MSQLVEAQTYPSMEAVITRFFERYNFEEEYPARLRFAKKPEGWTVYEGSFLAPDTVINEQLFWSAVSGRFLAINARGGAYTFQRTRDFEVRRYLREYQAEIALFDHSPFYGYKGWSEDVIQALERDPKLEEDALFMEGLAYAYWAEAVAPYRPTDPYVTGTDSPVGYEELPNKAFKQLRKGVQQALDAYEQIATTDPAYLMRDSLSIETFLPKTYMKASHLFLSLGEDKWAKNMLSKVDYSPKALSEAQILLASLNPESFLFTWEEEEIYPLWYLQQTTKIYSNLNVIHLPLLDELYYLEMLKDLQPSFSFSASLALFSNEKRQFVYLEEGRGRKPLSDLLTQAYSEDTAQQLKLVSAFYPYLPNRKFSMEISARNLEAAAWLSMKENRQTLMEGELEGNYLSRRTLILLDFLASYDWRSPIHFLGVPDEEIHFVEKYLTTYGQTYLLEPGMRE
ncbi:MAG: hypothetical protein AAF655_09455 [Bacteroidota bacterium]